MHSSLPSLAIVPGPSLSAVGFYPSNSYPPLILVKWAFLAGMRERVPGGSLLLSRLTMTHDIEKKGRVKKEMFTAPENEGDRSQYSGTCPLKIRRPKERKRRQPIRNESVDRWNLGSGTVCPLRQPHKGGTATWLLHGACSFMGLVPMLLWLRKNNTPLPAPVASALGSTHWHIRLLFQRAARKPAGPPAVSLR